MAWHGMVGRGRVQKGIIISHAMQARSASHARVVPSNLPLGLQPTAGQ